MASPTTHAGETGTAMVAFGGGGDGDSLERLRREVESQRARIRELEATNRAQEEALSQRDRQLGGRRRA